MSFWDLTFDVQTSYSSEYFGHGQMSWSLGPGQGCVTSARRSNEVKGQIQGQVRMSRQSCISIKHIESVNLTNHSSDCLVFQLFVFFCDFCSSLACYTIRFGAH